jgi:hypothetical protein
VERKKASQTLTEVHSYNVLHVTQFMANTTYRSACCVMNAVFLPNIQTIVAHILCFIKFHIKTEL